MAKDATIGALEDAVFSVLPKPQVKKMLYYVKLAHQFNFDLLFLFSQILTPKLARPPSTVSFGRTTLFFWTSGRTANLVITRVGGGGNTHICLYMHTFIDTYLLDSFLCAPKYSWQR